MEFFLRDMIILTFIKFPYSRCRKDQVKFMKPYVQTVMIDILFLQVTSANNLLADSATSIQPVTVMIANFSQVTFLLAQVLQDSRTGSTHLL